MTDCCYFLNGFPAATFAELLAGSLNVSQHQPRQEQRSYKDPQECGSLGDIPFASALSCVGELAPPQVLLSCLANTGALLGEASVTVGRWSSHLGSCDGQSSLQSESVRSHAA